MLKIQECKRAMMYGLPLIMAVVLSVVLAGCSADTDADSSETTDPVAERVTLNYSTLSMLPQDTETLRATVTPSDVTSPVSWSASTTGIVTLNTSGNTCTITAVKAGTVTITATVDEKSATCRVTVQAITVTLDKTSILMVNGQSESINATVTPSNAKAYMNVTSSDSSVATGSSTTIKAQGKGTATITFDVRGTKATCSVEVLGGSYEYYDSGNYSYLRVSIDAENGVGLDGKVTQYEQEVTGIVTATATLSNDGSLSSSASAYLVKCLEVVSGKGEWVPVATYISGGQVTKTTLNADVMSAMSGARSSMILTTGNGGATLDKASVKGLAAGGAWTFAITKIDNKTSIEGAEVFRIDMTSGSKSVYSVNGTATFNIPSSLSGDVPKAYSVSADGKTESVDASYNNITGETTVTASSWNAFAISSEGGSTSTGMSTLSLVAVIVIVMIAALCLFFCYRYLLM